MAIWQVLLCLGGAGIVGGLLNAFMTEEGFVVPRLETLGARRIWRPGFLGNMFVGLITAVVMAGLYSPLGSAPLDGVTDRTSYILTIGGIVGALLSGLGGARLLTNEVERRFEHVTRDRLGAAVDDLAKSQLPGS